MPNLVDVEKTLNSKKKGKKKAPKLLVWLLKKIIHQDEINSFLNQNNATGGIEFCDQVLSHLNVKIKTYGLEKIDISKRYIFASNHPLGGLDGMGLIKTLGLHCQGRFRLLANDILLNFEALKDITLPVNMHGSQKKDFSDKFSKLFEENNSIMLFPAGACSRYEPGQGIVDCNWKRTVVVRSVQHKVDIIPIRFVGRNSIFFYSLAFFRKKLGIKANIEMLFLAHEMFSNKNKTFEVHIGDPIPWQTFDKSKSPYKWAQEVKKIAYNIR